MTNASDAAALDVSAPGQRGRVTEWFEKLTKKAMFCPAGITLHEMNNASTHAGCEIDFNHLLESYVELTNPSEAYLRETAGAGITLGLGMGEPVDLGRIWQLTFPNRMPEAVWKCAVSTESKDAVQPLARSLLESILLMGSRQVSLPALASAPTLLALSGLPSDWDGYGGRAIDQAVVDRAFQALTHLAAAAAFSGVSLPPPSVGPSADGSIHFEWEVAEGYLTVECPPNRAPFSFYMELRNGTEEDGRPSSLGGLWEAVAHLFS